MGQFALTGIKSKDYDKVLNITNSYFEKFKLHLVEERIGERKGKFVTSPKSYTDLKDYDKKELEPFLQTDYEFTTNFDFYSSLEENPEWCIFAYYTRLARLTLNIDEDLSSFISKNLDVLVFDHFVYTVSSQEIIRGFERGEIRDMFLTGDGEVEEADGYFEKLRDYTIEEQEKVPEDEIQEWLDKKAGIIDGFWNYINFKLPFNELTPSNEKSRRPMYLKGKPDDIIKFLKYKDSTFFIV